MIRAKFIFSGFQEVRLHGVLDRYEQEGHH